MHASNIFLFLSAAGALAVPAPVPVAKHHSCNEKIKMISARGTGAPPGPGGMYLIADQIIAALPGSNPVLKSTVYPAVESNPPYLESVTIGAHNTQSQIIKAVDRCPDVKIVLFGYSQGAHVVLDAAFGSINTLNMTQPLPLKYQNRIKAIVVMGDPSHYQPQTFLYGNGYATGVIPREMNYNCSPLTSRIISFCDAGDPYCTNGNNQTVHNTYLNRYQPQAVAFTLKQLAL